MAAFPLDDVLTRLDDSDRLYPFLAFSAVFHIFLLYGVAFTLPEPRLNEGSSTMEVVLVNSKTFSRPAQADAYAQNSLDGGGNTDEARIAKNPLPLVDQNQKNVSVAQAESRVKQLEEEAQKLMTKLEASRTFKQTPVQKQTDDTRKVDSASLIEKSLAAARLEAQIAQDWDRYQKRPRRKFVGARTQEYRFARYVEDWRMKVERIGNMNYPEEAKANKIYGNLQLTVSIKADGSVENIEINRSSGFEVLDAAAIRIVRLASPFAPFPENISKDTDILGITRTWIFTHADQLMSK
jgi:protein TonB